MGNPGHNCLVECIEQVLWSESASASLPESTGIELLEHGGLNAVGDGLVALTALVSTGFVQAVL